MQRTNSSAPGGISQLRKASDQVQETGSDSMNLDEFIFSDNISTPAGATSSPELEKKEQLTSTTTAAAIPIKAGQRKETAQNFVPQSVPAKQLAGHRGQDEFGYVQRRIRKTSIDERRVCIPVAYSKYLRVVEDFNSL